MVCHILLVALSLALGASALTQANRRTVTGKRLQFTKNGTFQLSIFEDLHYGEAEATTWGPTQDAETKVVINTVLDNENPQLVILNGDLITGEDTLLSNATNYIDQLVAPLVDRQLLWASTYGNHDSGYNLSRSAILEREKTYSNSLTKSMVSGVLAGVSNYYLPVYPSDSSKDTPAFTMWFFDSRGGNYYQQLKDGSEVPQPCWVDESVVEWFTQTNTELRKKYGRVIPSIAFYHIPVNAMLAFQKQGVNANYEPGINDDNPLAQQGEASGQGEVSGTVFSYSGQDIPFMEAMLNTEGLLATFSGHDHGDDWCFKWDSKLPGMNLTGNGLNLCFGRHTGYGGYGSWTRGSRQILLDEMTLEKQILTWVRLEDGSVSGKVNLNSTYGEDWYPSVTTTYT
ncbi:Metallo-dependent phosphatase-like protein [Aspergillus pseudonomiae]|uniref:Metallo-dependent phosphatase-like protein n=1 Tax=Aspergillus pseudonomiae TaxID=1506151 RepID=A0A5N7DRT2_9EURO|nr:Metallo-dependent phosphatase-like protein [Aspergillus pseudonomiae]KAB8264304.1 Metallo-dependent phosphatase-like protein [Aspergillus pseudonomiae]KAE8409152.1 Metallo-dependent phosphatase-like protein [Aspergillus pseudonomiae]